MSKLVLLYTSDATYLLAPTRKSGSLTLTQVILLFLQLWPSLTTLISQWASDQDIVEVSPGLRCNTSDIT